MEEKHENYIEAVKMKMSGSKKKQIEQEHKHFLDKTKLKEVSRLSAYTPSQDSSQDSTPDLTIFRFPAIFTSCKSHDH